MIPRFSSISAAAALAALLVLAAHAPALAAQDSRVGFVNPQRVINESGIGRVAQADLGRLGREKDRIIRESASTINQLKKDLAGNAMSAGERQLKQDALEVQYRKHDQLVDFSNEEIKAEEAKLIQFIMEKADDILKSIARKGGYTMILTDPNIIGYIDDSVDLTDQVIRRLDALDR